MREQATAMIAERAKSEDWRREWDSNPRYLAVHTLSKRAP
jgi:hypothetical protein